MFAIEQTARYALWFRGLRDHAIRGRITARIERVQRGNFGDVKSIGEGLRELRLPFGPGYRIYFMHRRDRVILLLCGGDKGSQARDIALAWQIASEMGKLK